MTKNTSSVRQDLILGSKRISNYFWLICSFLGGLGFVSVGLASYFQLQLFFLKSDIITFIPQGILMTFYGFTGMLLGLFLFWNVRYDVGGGYNKYDKNTQKIELFRLGFPLKARELYLTYSFKEINSIKLRIEEGINPIREIYLCTKDKRQIPLTRVGEPILLSSIEREALELASFLMIPLEEK